MPSAAVASTKYLGRIQALYRSYAHARNFLNNAGNVSGLQYKEDGEFFLRYYPKAAADSLFGLLAQ